MANDIERVERELRAERLRMARKAAGFRGPRDVVARIAGTDENRYKAHEQGRNGFGLADARRYAKAFNVNLQWLNFGIGNPDDPEIDETLAPIAVPIIAWVSAGAMDRDDAADDALGTIAVPALPPGDWVALRVDGTSMDKVSPPGSIIFVNRKDKNLVPNGLYVIADEEGQATYKRYRPDPDRFEPVSMDDSHDTLFPEGATQIVGRVRRTMLDM